jgi:hypothetical protein
VAEHPLFKPSGAGSSPSVATFLLLFGIFFTSTRGPVREQAQHAA